MIGFPEFQFTKPTYIHQEENFFTGEEVDKILNDLKDVSYERGATGDLNANKDSLSLKIRKSNIKWIPHEEKFFWLYDKLSTQIHLINSFTWKFNLNDSFEHIQYTEYDSKEKGQYNWHVDVGEGMSCFRKISISIQLSNADEYDGGEFRIFNQKGPSPKSRGTAIIFPSFTPHKVTPVTRGNRKSLVLWVGGSPYK